MRKSLDDNAVGIVILPDPRSDSDDRQTYRENRRRVYYVSTNKIKYVRGR